MAVELTPGGTRGRQIPKMPRPLMRVLQVFLSLRVRLRGGRVFELTTVGAKSGQPHAVPLSWFPDGPHAWLVVASYGGAPRHPAWYVNMAHHPDQVWITIQGRQVRVQAESLHGAARTTAWQRIVAQAPGYRAYQEQTDREIPVIRLTPAPPESAAPGRR